MFNFILYSIPVVLLLLKLYEIYFRRKIVNIKTGECVQGPSIFYFFKHALFGRKPLQESLGEVTQGQDMYSFFFPHFHLLEIRSPFLAEKFLSSSDFEKINITFSENLNRFLGKVHVGAVEGEDWKRQRRILNKAFHSLDNYISIFEKKSIESLNLLKEQDIDDVGLFTQKITVDVLGSTLFGYDFGALKGSCDQSLESYNFLLQHLVSNFAIAIQMLTSKYSNFFLNKDIPFHLENLDNMRRKLIERSKEKILKSEINGPLSMLDMMVAESLSSDKEILDEEVWDNAANFFFAGHDTTAGALAYSIYVLAEYPQIQEKLRQEILSKIDGSSIEYSKIKDIPYLIYFIKEILRYYPPAAIITPRMNQKSIMLGDYLIPAKTQITINISALHHSKEVYGDPEVFRPERWSPEEQAKRKIPKHAWIPFSGESRVCIGNQFSLAEQKIFLSHLLSKFKITALDKFHVQNDPYRDIIQGPLKQKVKMNLL